jgi:hypothetical protein
MANSAANIVAKTNTSNRFEKILRFADGLLLFSLFLALSSPFEMGFGWTTFAVAEPMILLLIVWCLFIRRFDRERDGSSDTLWLPVSAGFSVWAGFLWFLADNWKDRTPVLHALLLGIPLFYLLHRYFLKSEGDWKNVASLFILSAVPNVLLGFFQHVNGIGIAAKSILGWGGQATNIPISGFFYHPNDFAVYLYWPLVFAAGLCIQSGRWRRLFYGCFVIISCLELYWSGSRSTILTLAICIVALLLLLWLRQKRSFVLGMAALTGIAALGLAWVIRNFLPPGYSLSMVMSGRDVHWIQVIGFIVNSIALLPIGYLHIPYPLEYQPHNIYLMAWFYYGWPGVILVLGFAWQVIRVWLKKYSILRVNLMLAVLWTGMAGFFFINGMAILYFHEPFFMLAFVCVAAMWARIHAMLFPRLVSRPASESRIP